MELIHAPASFAEGLVRLALATAVGAIVGGNRELQRKAAGLRTHALAALGAALMIIIGLSLPGADAAMSGQAVSRVVQGIVAGIGFIGGGVIMYRGDTRGVHGLTTAAAVWVVTAAGMAIGGGMWETGVAAGGLTLVVLHGGKNAGGRVGRPHR